MFFENWTDGRTGLLLEVLSDLKTDKLFCYEKDFALELSILLLGTVEDKLRWMFKLYDLNKVKHEIPLSKID